MTIRLVQTHLRIVGALPTGFRSALQLHATKQQVKGWVRATDDGAECVLQGGESAVAAVQRWCSHGPLAAGATVTATPQPREAFFGFDVRH